MTVSPEFSLLVRQGVMGLGALISLGYALDFAFEGRVAGASVLGSMAVLFAIAAAKQQPPY